MFMKKLATLILWGIINLHGMQTEQPLPYQSDYFITESTNDIENQENKSIIAGFMQRCC